MSPPVGPASRSPRPEAFFRAVVFDFDGVIVDTEPLHYQAFLEGFRALGLTLGYPEYLARYVGLDDRDAYRAALLAAGRPPDEARVERLCRDKALRFRRLLDAGVEEVPGSVAMIRALHAESVPLAVASGSVEYEIRLVLGRLGVTGCFQALVAADHVGASKPDPATHCRAVDLLAEAFPGEGILPAACLAIEDTPTGVTAAKRAGLPVLALTTTTGADDLAEADWVLDDLQGLHSRDLLRARLRGLG
ncbi:MAG: HAD family phosphatase [Acidobacteria bacterium]|nr:HAD family phosphatase [Acidobacteriota bacterium]